MYVYATFVGDSKQNPVFRAEDVRRTTEFGSQWGSLHARKRTRVPGDFGGLKGGGLGTFWDPGRGT